MSLGVISCNSNISSYFKIIILMISWNWGDVSTNKTSNRTYYSVNLTALSMDQYVSKLYLEKGSPSEPDLATWDPQVRSIICSVLLDTGYFFIFDQVPIEEIFQKRKDKEYTEIFDQLYIPVHDADSQLKYHYRNPFNDRNFTINRKAGVDSHIDYDCTESVLICPLRNRFSTRLTSIFVSKEYNVSPFIDLYMPGRFVFYLSYHPNKYSLILAEEPAIPFVDTNNNVEDRYLQIRKYIEIAGSNEVDPLCKLVSGRLESQHDRLCVAIGTSSHFRGRISYPVIQPSECFEQDISFRTSKAIDGKSYRERMMRCHAYDIDPHYDDFFFYISRGYKSNLVFVYETDRKNGKIYLENMSTGVKVVDEINSFDFVEN